MAEFVVHKSDGLDSDELNYLVDSEPMVTGGFVAGSPAYAYAVNAILHETSLVITALAKNIGTVTPDTSLADMQSAITTYLVAIKPTAAVTADKVSNSLTYSINGSTQHFNGSNTRILGMIYAPTTAGSSGQLLKSSGGIPAWLTTTKGNATTPIYYSADSDTFTVCNLYAGGTAITLNNVSKAANTASFYAPTSSGTKGQLLVSNGTSSAPKWLSNSYGTATKPIYYSNSADTFVVCNKYAGGTAITLNDNDKSSNDCVIYAPDTYSRTANGSDTIVVRETYTEDNVTKYKASFTKAPISTFTVDAGWMLTGRLVFAVDSNNQVTTANTVANGLFAHCYYGLNYGSNSHFDYYSNISADSDDAKLKERRWSWSSWGFTHNIGEAMRLSVPGSSGSSIKLTVNGIIDAVSFNATSDERKKQNIEDYTPEKSILDLPVKQFDMIKDGSHHIGCIAQDLQKIAPELVHEDEEGYLTIEETKLVYLLLDEVKKLRKEIDELKGTK